MPADPIEFRIVKSLQAALKTISTASGYHYTVQGLAVKLDPEHKVEELIPGADPPFGPPRPWMVLDVSASASYGYFPSNQRRGDMPFTLHIIHDSDVVDDDAKLKTFFRLVADGEQALAVDIARGGLAVDTVITGRTMRDNEGQEVWAQLVGHVRYHSEYGKPNG